jgi:putative membrane protein
MILPFGLLDELQWWSVPLSIILYYIMMSIVLTAEEIEDPFGKDLNDLPMDEIASNIRKNVMELVKYE